MAKRANFVMSITHDNYRFNLSELSSRPEISAGCSQRLRSTILTVGQVLRWQTLSHVIISFGSTATVSHNDHLDALRLYKYGSVRMSLCTLWRTSLCGRRQRCSFKRHVNNSNTSHKSATSSTSPFARLDIPRSCFIAAITA